MYAMDEGDEMRRQVEERVQQRLHLSMGMSNDWEVAVRCGASQVRIGRLIFGSGSVDKQHDVLQMSCIKDSDKHETVAASETHLNVLVNHQRSNKGNGWMKKC